MSAVANYFPTPSQFNFLRPGHNTRGCIRFAGGNLIPRVARNFCIFKNPLRRLPVLSINFKFEDALSTLSLSFFISTLRASVTRKTIANQMKTIIAKKYYRSLSMSIESTDCHSLFQMMVPDLTSKESLRNRIDEACNSIVTCRIPRTTEKSKHRGSSRL